MATRTLDQSDRATRQHRAPHDPAPTSPRPGRAHGERPAEADTGQRGRHRWHRFSPH